MKGSALRERLEAAFTSLCGERCELPAGGESTPPGSGHLPFLWGLDRTRPMPVLVAAFQLLPSARGFLALAVLVHFNVRVRKIKHNS